MKMIGRWLNLFININENFIIGSFDMLGQYFYKILKNDYQIYITSKRPIRNYFCKLFISMIIIIISYIFRFPEFENVFYFSVPLP